MPVTTHPLARWHLQKERDKDSFSLVFSALPYSTMTISSFTLKLGGIKGPLTAPTCFHSVKLKVYDVLMP